MGYNALQSNASENAPWLVLLEMLRDRIRLACEVATDGSVISVRDLETVLLLHLPRFSGAQLFREKVIETEAARLCDYVASWRHAFSDWSNRPRIQEFHRQDMNFAVCPNWIAQTVYERFHYIGACREGIAHLGLFHSSIPEIPMALMTLSEMDIEHLKHFFEGKSNRALVVSRSFAFDWAPRNSISFLTARIRDWIREHKPDTKMLLTYINPNLRFKGTSYAASAWHLFGSKEMRYRYFHDHYITYRDMLRLSAEEKSQITTSQIPLAPLSVLATKVEGGGSDITDFNV